MYLYKMALTRLVGSRPRANAIAWLAVGPPSVNTEA